MRTSSKTLTGRFWSLEIPRAATGVGLDYPGRSPSTRPFTEAAGLCSDAIPSLRKAGLPGSCNLAEWLGMSPSRLLS